MVQGLLRTEQLKQHTHLHSKFKLSIGDLQLYLRGGKSFSACCLRGSGTRRITRLDVYCLQRVAAKQLPKKCLA